MLYASSMRGGLIYVTLLVSFLTTCFLGGILIYYIVQENRGQVQAYRKDLESLVDVRLLNETQIAMSTLRELYAKQQLGLLTEKEAKREAADLVRAFRYDNGEGYFWIDTEEGVNVVLMGTVAEGKPRMDATDPTGKRFVAEIIENAKQPGGGYTNFMFPKPGEVIPMPKRAYGAFFEPWGWIIGTGSWTDSIDRMVDERKALLDKRFQDRIYGAIFILVLLQGLFVLMSLYIGGNMSRPILAITDQLRKMGSGDLSMDEAAAENVRKLALRKDELGVMGRAMQEMRDRLFEYQNTILGMARKDALTGLANRRHFQEYLEGLGSGRRFVFVSLDLDHFKEVNDTWGHQTGDAALLILAEVLKSSFSDGLNVRMGGDEFLVVLPGNTAMDEVEKRLTAFMDQLVAIYRTDACLEKLTISAGVAASSGEGEPVDLLLQKSDAALYQAKTAGRSCYRVYDESMQGIDFKK